MRNRSTKDADPESARLLPKEDDDDRSKKSRETTRRAARIEPFKCSPNLTFWDFVNPIKLALIAVDVFLIMVRYIHLLTHSVIL
ncbi:hypothetical protein OAV88_01920 [bacterium]|nr:hypothetical protein [bacterium]